MSGSVGFIAILLQSMRVQSSGSTSSVSKIRVQLVPPLVVLHTPLFASWAELSIGSADGVKKDMVFHVTRGDRFLCDIVIFEVDPDKAVGKMELVQETPKAGDTVCTNL